jgi:hypothetical protein
MWKHGRGLGSAAVGCGSKFDGFVNKAADLEAQPSIREANLTDL